MVYARIFSRSVIKQLLVTSRGTRSNSNVAEKPIMESSDHLY